MASTSSEQDARIMEEPSPLLELPGELRNRIFRYTLVSDDEIRIDKTNFKQPALLQTCWIIRSEASAIYYHENRFHFDINYYDSTAQTSWYQHAGPHRSGGIHVTNGYPAPGLYGLPRCSWSNLLTWLRRCHAQLIPTLRPLNSAAHQDEFEAQVFTLFHIVELLMGTPWQTVSKVLEAQKKLLGHIGAERIAEGDPSDEDEDDLSEGEEDT